MAKIHGRGTSLQLTDVGGVNRDISNFLTAVDFPFQADQAEVSAFGDTDKSYVMGLKSHTMKLTGLWDPTATTGPDEVLSGLVGGGAAGTVPTTFIFGPNGTVAGRIKYTGTAWVTAYNVNNPIGGAITFGADLMVNGAVTRTTF